MRTEVIADQKSGRGATCVAELLRWPKALSYETLVYQRVEIIDEGLVIAAAHSLVDLLCRHQGKSRLATLGYEIQDCGTAGLGTYRRRRQYALAHTSAYAQRPMPYIRGIT